MLKSLFMVASLATLAACQTANPDVVSRYDAERVSYVQDGTVLSVRPVRIDGSQSGIGGFSGAVIGGIAGSNVGGPRTGGIVGIVGAIAGGVIGNAVERGATAENGVELLIQMKNGDRRSIVQANSAEAFAPGEPVVMVTTGGRARVTRAPDVATNAAPTSYSSYPSYPAPAPAVTQ